MARRFVSVTGIAEPEQVDSLFVTDGMLPILGVQLVRGRYFSRKDDLPGSPNTVMLTYGYWQRRFGGQSSAIGKRIVVDGRAHEIIGILPKSFHFMNLTPNLVLPFQLDRNKSFVGNFSYQAVARLKPRVTISQANADVARMLPIMNRKFPMAPGMNLKMLEEARLGPSVRPLKNDVVGDIGKVLWILMATVGIVLFIACANVANLLLVRAEGRQQELAICAALGANWSQIARQLLFESVALGVIGGVLGLGLADAALRLLVAMGPASLPRLDEISINLPVLLFTLVVSVLSGLLFGLMPVFKYAGPQLGTALREGGRDVERWQRTAPRAEHAGGGANSARARAADQFGAHDSHASGIAASPTRLHDAKAGAYAARVHSQRAGTAARPRSPHGQRHDAENRRDAGRYVSWSLQLHYDGRRKQQRSDLCGRPGLC